ncbi:MAG TPA: SDR family oxidoreductase [Pseudonocardiaceae bacterium]|jgi:NAD(P)-dependent dehydrogenase (short-subunit alcohol dehydrogenase family)
MTENKIWFITGAGRGLGKEFAIAALQRGDKVAATARNLDDVGDLVEKFGDDVLPVRLDVTDRPSVFAAVEQATGHFGRLDVVVNNAGYGLFGAVEELSEQQLRDQLEVNLFGVLHVTQAVLPVLRGQGSGHIVQISTIGGVAAFPSLGGYHASKWALEGLSESLAQEVAPFGITVTLVEPGGFATDWAGSSAVHATAQPQYDSLRQAMAERRRAGGPVPTAGDPVAAGQALLAIVDADEPPLRVFFGVTPTMIVPTLYQARLDNWEKWKHVAVAAHGH